MKTKIILLGAVASMCLFGCKNNNGADEYDGDKLKVSFRNLYFDNYSGGDSYIKEVEDMFGLSFKLEPYSWQDWTTQVNGHVLAGNSPDVFHANIDSYNFVSYYKYWAEDKVIKQLPDDLSNWPNLKRMIDNTSNIEALKLDGHLYGIPIAKNTTDFSTSFSPFTYLYRRDWAKQYGVYQENDEYTWEQFNTLLDKFNRELSGKRKFALGDVEWGFPSITNFYKQVPHCFAYDETERKYVNNYSTDEYILGLEKSKEFAITDKYYSSDQYTATEGKMNEKYYSNQCGVLYENLSYSNMEALRIQLKRTNVNDKDFNVDDATAIMKIKGPDGKYALEGTDNWFSMTFINNNISEMKLNKILDLYDWLLSESGTNFAIYGFEGYDYTKDETGKVEIVRDRWYNDDGSLIDRVNGAKYLRYMLSLGYDTLEYDPMTEKSVVQYLNDWDAQMKTALADGELRVLKESPEVMWLTSEKKALHSGTLRTNALKTVTKYVFDKIKSINDYKSDRAISNGTWDQVLDEINTVLGGN
ncbi:MAG: extracellular solute-binding protein [Bacilli bacterium]|nr:extracellular solute-binding protein [Bacilli bacterium]